MPSLVFENTQRPQCFGEGDETSLTAAACVTPRWHSTNTLCITHRTRGGFCRHYLAVENYNKPKEHEGERESSRAAEWQSGRARLAAEAGTRGRCFFFFLRRNYNHMKR